MGEESLKKFFCFSQVDKTRRKLNKDLNPRCPFRKKIKNQSFQISEKQEVIIKRYSNATIITKIFV